MAIGVNFYRELPELKPLDSVRAYKGSVLILHGSADQAVPPDEGHAYERAFISAQRFEFRLIEGADHTFTQPETEQILIRQTSEWLRTHLGELKR